MLALILGVIGNNKILMAAIIDLTRNLIGTNPNTQKLSTLIAPSLERIFYSQLLLCQEEQDNLEFVEDCLNQQLEELDNQPSFEAVLYNNYNRLLQQKQKHETSARGRLEKISREALKQVQQEEKVTLDIIFYHYSQLLLLEVRKEKSDSTKATLENRLQILVNNVENLPTNSNELPTSLEKLSGDNDYKFIKNGFIPKAIAEDLGVSANRENDKSKVELLQEALSSIGFYTDKVTGTYDEKTINAVNKFQEEILMKEMPTSNAREQTWKKLQPMFEAKLVKVAAEFWRESIKKYESYQELETQKKKIFSCQQQFSSGVGYIACVENLIKEIQQSNSIEQ